MIKCLCVLVFFFAGADVFASSHYLGVDTIAPPVQFINTSFENASLVSWAVEESGVVNVDLIYDRQRESANRANGHWFFQVQTRKGTDFVMMLNNMDNIWNNNHASVISKYTHCYVSPDGIHWNTIDAEKTTDNKLKIKFHAAYDSFYVAGVEPYRISDLEKLYTEIKKNKLVKIDTIGHTVLGRPLEIVRVGSVNAPHRIFIRARAHGFEAGGNWVVQGIIRGILKNDLGAKHSLEKYCLYILPMANKDAVARGRTRFNSEGIDLNRGWGAPADPHYAPENAALENWIKKMIAAGEKPDLAIDFHNDAEGHLHLSPPNRNISYLPNMKRFESLLRKHTWFTEGTIGGDTGFRNPSSIGEGLLYRYGIDAMVYELNYEWIAGLNKVPFGKDWESLGEKLNIVFADYFDK
jgi:hypothetical protein